MTPTAIGSFRLPDYLGFGWLDRDSFRELDGNSEFDFVHGEDLVYRVRRSAGGAWSVTEFLDLAPVSTGDGPSLSEAVGSMVAASASLTEPVVWARLRRHLRDRVDLTTVAPQRVIEMWGLFHYQILALYRGSGRPPAPDLRPKSYQVRRGRPPRPSGDLIHFSSPGIVRDEDVEVPETPCGVVSYRTPAINVVPVIEALLEGPDLPPPWRVVVHAGHPGVGKLRCHGRSGKYELDLDTAT